MSDARAAILSRLRATPPRTVPERPGWTAPDFPDRWARFTHMIEAVHGQVVRAPAVSWRDQVRDQLAARGAGLVMAAPALGLDWPQGPRVVAYDQPVEDLKEQLVHHVDAGVVTARAAIAETGTLVLWPDADQPRLLSLLPPVSVVVVEADAIFDNLAQVMAAQAWAGAMPTNLLLVSGPSKTADIEQTLAYGVHGPKELIVVVVER